MSIHSNFRTQLKTEFAQIISQLSSQVPVHERLQIDMHCHDYNSDVPDEIWGRMLRVPETWVKTDVLRDKLIRAGSDIVTITNHNNARSCWDLLNRGEDILAAAEFTCHFPEEPVSVHVLTYGFTPEQEEKLKVHRHNIFRFLQYTAEHNIPTVLAHPLYYYTSGGYKMTLDLFERFALMFERFECFNGQRDVWQNYLNYHWVKSLSPQKIEELAKKHHIAPNAFCRDPYSKTITGGTDDHFAIFAGSTGTYLHVPNLAEKRKTIPLSHLALEAIRNGKTTPFGIAGEDEKLNTALVNYVCQLGRNIEDPGLIRLLLHQGDIEDKIGCYLVGNALLEVKRHKYTTKFFKAVNRAFTGRKINFFDKLLASKDYRSVIKEIENISKASQLSPIEFNREIRESYPKVFNHLATILSTRITKQFVSGKLPGLSADSFSAEEFLKKFEIPLHFRSILESNNSEMNVGKILDELSFPAITALTLGAASFISFKELFQKRYFFDQLGASLNPPIVHPKRALWITDTLYDHNGVSSVLQQTLDEVREKNLPIDFLVCSNEIQSGPHLQVVPAISTFAIPGYEFQKFNVPNPIELMQLVLDGGYDRLICSTEMLMGPVTLMLKKALSIPAWFYMHTDWMDYVKRNSNLNSHEQDRVRRVLRFFYKSFDGVFALNTEHAEWLKGNAIGIDKDKVHLTAHWADKLFAPPTEIYSFPGDSNSAKVLLYAGRLSAEKGVFDLAEIYAKVSEVIPGTKLLIAGTGPAEAELKKQLPDAVFLGWVDRKNLPALYARADYLVLPSRFDTFGCVVLEAMACGTPVAAYNTKGPADIISDGEDGVLRDNPTDLAFAICQTLQNQKTKEDMVQNALAKSKQYNPQSIMKLMLRDLKLS
jgi:glycosyltransferase involved in cell wall biosynthesis